MSNKFLINSQSTRLEPIGTNGQIIVADNTAARGWIWANLLESSITPDLSLAVSPTIEFILVGSGIEDPVFNVTVNRTLDTFTANYVDTNTGSDSQTPDIIGGQTTVTGTFLSFSTVGNGSFFNFVAEANSTQGNQSVGVNLYLQAANLQFYGVATGSLTYDESFIKSLSSSGLHSYPSGLFNFDLDSGEYFWYATRENGPQPSFRHVDSDLIGGFVLEATGISLTNHAGHNEDYRLWRTEFPNLGDDINIEVSGVN